MGRLATSVEIRELPERHPKFVSAFIGSPSDALAKSCLRVGDV